MIIPDYIVPTDKKRVAVRQNIKMKMLLANGIEFPSSSVNVPAKKKRTATPGKISIKVT